MPKVARVMILTTNLETSQLLDGASASSSEVSWQTCFWILITIGLNTMFQPCGRVCGIDKRYSTSMRSLPLVCFADTASILGRLSYAWLKLKISFRKCVRYTMNERLQGTGFLEGMKNLKNTTWLRWLLFILRPLPQAIRLASFRGIPWTQFLGFSFLSSWLLVEIMVLVSTGTAIQLHASSPLTSEFPFSACRCVLQYCPCIYCSIYTLAADHSDSLSWESCTYVILGCGDRRMRFRSLFSLVGRHSHSCPLKVHSLVWSETFGP